jgi:hypothetical protein
LSDSFPIKNGLNYWDALSSPFLEFISLRVMQVAWYGHDLFSSR